jgi:hypothetical protein
MFGFGDSLVVCSVSRSATFLSSPRTVHRLGSSYPSDVVMWWDRPSQPGGKLQQSTPVSQSRKIVNVLSGLDEMAAVQLSRATHIYP